MHPAATGATNHVGSYDFVVNRTHDGKVFWMLCIIDEFTRESLMIRVARKFKATDITEALCELFVSRAFLRTYAQTMAPSLSRRLSGTRSLPSEPKLLISNLEVHGSTAIAKASTVNYATNCSTARCSTH